MDLIFIDVNHPEMRCSERVSIVISVLDKSLQYDINICRIQWFTYHLFGFDTIGFQYTLLLRGRLKGLNKIFFTHINASHTCILYTKKGINK